MRALALILLAAACREHAPVVQRDEPPPVHREAAAVTLPVALEADGRVVTDAVRRGAVRDVVAAPCEVVAAPGAVADIATTVLARVVAWHVAPGERVRAGQAVVTLDAPDVADQRSALARAALDAADLEQRLREELAMRDAGVTTARALRESQTALARARAARAAARRSLAVAQASESGDGGSFTLRAPIAGTVTRREAARGAVVEAPSVLATLTDLTALRVAVSLPEHADDVPLGAGATVTLRGHAATLRARVTWRDPQLRRDTRTRVVHLTVEGAAPLSPGETGTARVEHASAEAGVRVPTSAVHREGERATLYVRVAPGRYEAREVVTGRESDGVVEVVSGLDEGAAVVVRGAALVAAEHARQRGAEGP